VQVLRVQDILGACHNSLNVILKFVGASKVFQVSPESFDGIEI
jgi:hypothetical protein